VAIALLPGYRGRGIGSQLLACLLESARPHCAAVSLSVVAASPATRLYRRFGFEVVREDGSGLTMVKRYEWPSEHRVGHG
jgi:ribosomal protein S18 acetylase RimI-like enzyme